jgi:hypothetical protein
METKKYIYAAVGAPVTAAKVAQTRVDEIRTKLTKNAETFGKDLRKQVEEWAAEGEKLVNKIGESKALDDLSERVDLDQVQEQVSKLRDQLEDLLSTWRSNFRPVGAAKPAPKAEKIVVTEPKVEAKPAAKPAAAKPAAKKPAAKKPAAKKPAAKKPASAGTATRKTASKAS